MISIPKLSRELESGLAPLGFELSYFSESEVVFFASQKGSMFHRIRVSRFMDGKHFSAGVELSVVPGRTALKSLCIHNCLMEAADNADGIARVGDSTQLDRFLNRLIAFGPDRCREIEQRDGPGLKSATQSARLACAKYLKRLRDPNPPLRNGTTDHFADSNLVTKKEVDRILAEWIQCIPNAGEVYREVVHVIVRECDDVEGVQGWIENRQANSASDRELMMRIQILASIVACEPGADRIELTI